MTLKVGDQVKFVSLSLPHYGETGEIIEVYEAMGNYNVRTRSGDFWRYDNEIEPINGSN